MTAIRDSAVPLRDPAPHSRNAGIWKSQRKSALAPASAGENPYQGIRKPKCLRSRSAAPPFGKRRTHKSQDKQATCVFLLLCFGLRHLRRRRKCAVRECECEASCSAVPADAHSLHYFSHRSNLSFAILRGYFSYLHHFFFGFSSFCLLWEPAFLCPISCATECAFTVRTRAFASPDNTIHRDASLFSERCGTANRKRCKKPFPQTEVRGNAVFCAHFPGARQSSSDGAASRAATERPCISSCSISENARTTGSALRSESAS